MSVYSSTTTSEADGGYSTVVEQEEALIMVGLYDWLWPLSKRGIQEALQDIRCNPNVSPELRSLTSLSDPQMKVIAATQMFRTVPLWSRPKPSAGTFKVTWADGGSSTFVVNGILSDGGIIAQVAIILSDGGIIAQVAIEFPGDGVAKPSRLCPKRG